METHTRDRIAPLGTTGSKGPATLRGEAQPQTESSTKLGDILALRVGCWQAPVYLTVELPAAS